MKLYDLFNKSVEEYPNNIALTIGEKSYSFQTLSRSAKSIANYLHKTNASENIGLLLDNSVEYVVSFLGITASGKVIVPIDTSASFETIGYIINNCKIDTLITEKKYQRKLNNVLPDVKLKRLITIGDFSITHEQVEFINIEDIFNEDSSAYEIESGNTDIFSKGLAAIFYTSGSTGKPKGVMLSHENLLSNTITTIEYLKLSALDSVMVVLPFYYIYGNSLMLTHLGCGGRMVIDNTFMYPEVILDLMEEQKVTGLSGVPSNFMIMLDKTTFSKRQFPHLRYFTQAGGSMPTAFIKKLIDSFPEKEIYIMYGQTEASPRITYLPYEKLREKLGSIGIPLDGVSVWIVDDEGNEVGNNIEGELVVAGPNVMMGYYDKDENDNVLIDGRLYTGDLAKKDDDGYIYIVGRKKEIIKSGGNRISAKEIEDCLAKHDNITEVAVVGVEDAILGEAVKAFVVLKETLGKDEIYQFCKSHLPSHKIPKDIEICESLPKKPTGKIDKNYLKEKYNLR